MVSFLRSLNGSMLPRAAINLQKSLKKVDLSILNFLLIE